MSSVDDRIVNMQFNNTQFQTGAADSTKSLQTLEQTIAGMGKSGNGLDSMGTSVDGIRAKFSALQVAGVTALATIVNKAVTAGLQLVKSMTLDPLLQGFQEYETNLNSIQTIMANTGVEIKVVNKYLDELNEYSDRTIYNFSQMAQNIGRFTAAGVELRTATDAIKGLANTAALSGSNVEQLNTAMYQMSQALSTGTIRLMDWNSLANAGMGGENIRNALMATNRTLADHGAAMDEAIAATGNFRDSLQYGWLSAETFTKTMKVMAGTTNDAGETVAFTVEQLKKMGYTTDAAKELNRLSQASIDAATKVKTFSQLIDVVKESIGSGWAQVFENLFGNFNQASKLWTGVSESITGFVKNIFDSVNSVLESWRELGGYQDLWNGFGNIFQALGNLLAPFVEAFKALTPTAGAAGSTLAKVTGAFETFTGWLVTLTEGLNVLTPIIAAVFTVFKTIGSVVGSVAQGLAPVVDLIKELAGGMGDLAQQGSEISGNILAGLLEGLDVSAIKTAVENFATSIVDWIKNALGIASPAAELVPVGLAIVQGVAEGIANGIRLIGDVLNTLIDAILDILPGIAVRLATAVVVIVQSIAKVLPQLRTALGSIIATILGFIGDAIPEIASLANTLIDSLINIIVVSAPKLASGLNALIGAALDVISTNIPKFIEVGLAILLAIVAGVAENLPKIASYLADVVTTLIGTLLEVVGSLLGSISGSLELELKTGLSNMDWGVIFNALLTTGLVVTMIKLANTLSGFVDTIKAPFSGLTDTLGQMQQTLKANALLSIAIAVGILAASIIALSLLDPKDVAIGLGAIAGTLALLVGTLKAFTILIKDPTAIAGFASALLAISGAVFILSTALTILSKLSLGQLAASLGAVAASMIIMVTAMKALSGIGPGLPAAATAILIVSGAMVILASALAILGQLSLGQLAAGLGTVAAALTIFVVALGLLQPIAAGLAPAAGAILVISAAMVVLATALTMLGQLSLGQLAAGLGTIAAAIVIFSVALAALSSISATALLSAQAIIIMSAAMVVLATALTMIGNLSIAQIATGLGAITVALALLLAAAAGAQFVALGLLALGQTFLLLGAGAALLGAGLLAAATAFAIFTAVGSAGIAVMVAAITAFIALLPQIGIQFAAAFVTFTQTIAEAAPALRESFGIIIEEMLGTVEDAIPHFKTLANALIGALLDIIAKNIPKGEKVLSALIAAGLKVLRQAIPDFVRTGVAIVLGFLEGINDKMDRIIDAGTDLIVSFIEGIGDANERIIRAATKVIGDFVDALPPAVRDLTEDISGVGFDIALAIAQGLYDGLLSKGVELAQSAATALADKLPEWMKKVLGIASPSKVAHWIGEMFVEGLSRGIQDNVVRAVGATIRLANAVVAAGDKIIAKLQNEASKRQVAAEIAAAKARLAERQAAAAQKAADKKPNNKALQQAARNARKEADRKAKAAAQAQKRADAAAQKVTDKQEFRAADDQGKGDILTARAKELSDRAIKKLAEANAAAIAAKKAHGKERDRLLREAKQDAKAADRLAKASRKARDDADKYYAQSVRDRIKAINEQRKADEQQRKDEEEFNNATDAQKAEILQKRADAAQQRADTAQKQSEDLLKQARKLAKTDAAKAQRLLDRAQRLADEARDAADQAKQDQQQAQQYADQANNPSTNTGFNLSQSALEDAASAIDRYTLSLQQAEEAAAAATPVYQYVQNNYSPESLSDIEIYRQTGNLLTASEVKMGAK